MIMRADREQDMNKKKWKSLTFNQIKEYDKLFLTGTVTGIVLVHSIENCDVYHEKFFVTTKIKEAFPRLASIYK
jgi:branched-subunit amino acid aminotransferase/4-amino-4-deoxychorismate lyase